METAFTHQREQQQAVLAQSREKWASCQDEDRLAGDPQQAPLSQSLF